MRSLVNQGFITERGKVIVLSRPHAEEIEFRRAGGLVRLFGWDDQHLGFESIVHVLVEPTHAAQPATAGTSTSARAGAPSSATAGASAPPAAPPPSPLHSEPEEQLVDGLPRRLASAFSSPLTRICSPAPTSVWPT